MATKPRRRRRPNFYRASQVRYLALEQLSGLPRPELAQLLGVAATTIQAWAGGQERISPTKETQLRGIIKEQRAEAEKLSADGDVVIPNDSSRSRSWWIAVAARILADDLDRPVRTETELPPAAAELAWVLQNAKITTPPHHPLRLRLRHRSTRRETIAAAPQHRQELLTHLAAANRLNLDGHETRTINLPAATPDQTWQAWLETQTQQIGPNWQPIEVLNP